MGNFSRDTFDKLKHYVSVRLQQGVPLVDADWNEKEDIRRYELRAFLKWFVGDGVPRGNDGFRIEAIPADNDFRIKGGDDTTDGAGRILVDGWEVINESDLKYTQQPLYDNPNLATAWGVAPLPPLTTPTGGDRTDTVYLDVWEREVDSGEDPDLINSDIGLETCVRLKREWVVRVAEGTAVPSPPAGHVFYPLARLKRPAGQAAINATDITDLRRMGVAVIPEPLTIKDGNVGIGTETPQSPLHVNGTITTAWELTMQHYDPRWGDNATRPFLRRAWSGGTGDYLYIGATGNRTNSIQGALLMTEKQGIRFGKGTDEGNGLSTTHMVISDNGNVGIGTETPQSPLHVNGTITTAWELTMQHYDPRWGDNATRPFLRRAWSGGTGDYLYIGATGNRTNSIQGALLMTEKQGIRFGKGTDEGNGLSTTHMVISANGNVGIGTTAPTIALLAVSTDDRLSAVEAKNLGPLGAAGIFTNENSTNPAPALIAETKGTGPAARFVGDVHISGTITKGSNNFLIDHPLDPENKMLIHHSVESPENLCLYRGKVKLDAKGNATVKMPDYFAALTKEEEATVNLTAEGNKPTQLSYEWNKRHTEFTIFGEPNREVSYLVLADRDDPTIHFLAQPVEQEKGNGHCEKGKYLCPEAYGQPREMGMHAAMETHLEEILRREEKGAPEPGKKKTDTKKSKKRGD